MHPTRTLYRGGGGSCRVNFAVVKVAAGAFAEAHGFCVVIRGSSQKYCGVRALQAQ